MKLGIMRLRHKTLDQLLDHAQHFPEDGAAVFIKQLYEARGLLQFNDQHERDKALLTLHELDALYSAGYRDVSSHKDAECASFRSSCGRYMLFAGYHDKPAKVFSLMHADDEGAITYMDGNDNIEYIISLGVWEV